MSGGKRQAVVFDRDGVLNLDLGYVHAPEEFVWIPGAGEAIRRCNENGVLAVVATNQSGVGRGFYSEEAVDRLHAWMNERLKEQGARIDAFYICPHGPESDCECRKPKPGLFVRAIEELGIDPAASVSVGDKDRDVAASRAAGIRALLFPGGDLDEFLLRNAGPAFFGGSGR